MVVILKTLRTSREFFPDLIVYHSHQSDRKIYKKHTDPHPCFGQPWWHLEHPLSYHPCSCKGAQHNTGWDSAIHCYHSGRLPWLLSLTSHVQDVSLKSRARTGPSCARRSSGQTEPTTHSTTDIPVGPASHIVKLLFREVLGNPSSRPPLSRVARKYHVTGPTGSCPSQMFLLHLPCHLTR